MSFIRCATIPSTTNIVSTRVYVLAPTHTIAVEGADSRSLRTAARLTDQRSPRYPRRSVSDRCACVRVRACVCVHELCFGCLRCRKASNVCLPTHSRARTHTLHSLTYSQHGQTALPGLPMEPTRFPEPLRSFVIYIAEVCMCILVQVDACVSVTGVSCKQVCACAP